MAEGHVKQVLEKEVTCPLCLDIFKKPKKLPCDHVYCMGCLESLALRSLNPTQITCPECRTLVQVPNGSVSNFPTAFRLNRLVEAFQRIEIREETDSATVQETKCKEHPTQALALYCETCKTLLCRDCVIITKYHANHQYTFINEAKGKLQDRLLNTVSTLEDQGQSLSKVLDEIAVVESDVASCEQQCHQDIEQEFGALYRALQSSEKSMKEKASKRLKSTSLAVKEQQKLIKSVRSEIMNALEETRCVLQKGDEEFLIQQDRVQQNLQLLQEKLRRVPLIVDRPQLITPQLMTDEVLRQQLDKHNSLRVFDPSKWQASGTSFLSSANVGQQYIIQIENKSGKLWRGPQKGVVRCEARLVSIRDNSIVQGEIQQISPNHFTVSIRPQLRGQQKLAILVNSVHIANSPFNVFVHISPTQLSQPVAEISGLRHPASLCFSKGKVLASEMEDSRIIKITPGATSDNTRRLLELHGVAELTTDPQSSAIYATITTGRHQVCKFTANGSLIKTTGDYGRGPGQFNFPNGLRVSKQEELYVCDSENDRIQIFDLNLNFKRSFGSTGDDEGQFSFPSDIDFDSDGKIYVVDSDNHRLQVFTTDECILYSMGGTGPLLNVPLSMVIYNKLIFITEYENHRVSILTTAGKLVHTFGSQHLFEPEGITIDEDGYVYVTSHQSKILVF